MKILVTGCAGFIGFSLCKELITNSKNKIVGIDNLNNISNDKKLKIDRLNLIKNKLKFYSCNLEDEKKISVIFKKNRFDTVVHLGAQPGVRLSLSKPDIYFNSNIKGYYNILSCCRKFNVKHLIFASSSSVYGNQNKFPIKESNPTDKQISFYALTKKIGEMLSQTYSNIFSMKITSLRFFTVYGPYGRPDMAMYKFTDKIFKNQEIEIYNLGKHVRDFTYIDNIVYPIKKIIFKKRKKLYEVYNLASSKPKKLNSYVKEIENSIGKVALKKFVKLQKGDVYKTSASTRKLDKFVGSFKKINTRDGINNFVEWYQNYKKNFIK